MIKVGITGGIGSGKSTVCRLFAEFGVPVYDSDSEARRLMQEEPDLRRRISERFGREVYNPKTGLLDRRLLADRVFGAPEELAALDGVVHPVVMRDFGRWCGEHAEEDYVLLESAILFDAGLEGFVDRTVAVTAPLKLRIERTCLRDGASVEEVGRRIAAQLADGELRLRADYIVENTDLERLQPQVVRLDRLFRDEARR